MIDQLPPENPQALKGGASGDVTYCGQCGALNASGNSLCTTCGHSFVAATEGGLRSQDIPDAPPAAVTPLKACGCCAGTACAHDSPAGFGTRLLAFIIDVILIGIVAGILRGIDLRAVASLADFIYFVSFWSTTGQTVGMRAMRIRIVRIDGQPLSWVTGLVRYAGYILSIIPLCLGLLWILWDRDKQGWHDKIAHTLVVYTA